MVEKCPTCYSGYVGEPEKCPGCGVALPKRPAKAEKPEPAKAPQKKRRKPAV